MTGAVAVLDRMDLAWAVRRLPAQVRQLLKKRGPNLFLAGGYLRAIVAGEKASDIDLFTSSSNYAHLLSAELAGEDRIHETPNAFTVKTRPIPTQFIHRWTFSSPADAIASFDFTIAQAAIWFENGSWVSCCSQRFYPDLAAKRLIYTCPARVEEAGGSMLRVLKFYQRGYRIPLDSLGAVMARCARGVRQVESVIDEHELSKVITGLLREVDPNVDPDHIAHLPAQSEEAR